MPKICVNDDGSLGAHNDVVCAGVEHKLGIHASPTCVDKYGEKGEGAVGYLVGEENRGLNVMFIMMNAARLAVGMQGVAVAERATQRALSYARERRQGRSTASASVQMAPIIEHADIRRSLMTMKALTQAARAICLVTARETDVARRPPNAAERAAAQHRVALLTPVAKAFATDIGCEVASIGVQVHGGMGFIEETGAAQHYRDARILPIYEGTNGIQAMDLVARKLPLEGGKVVMDYIADLASTVEAVRASNRPEFGRMGQRLGEAVAAFAEATRWIGGALNAIPTAPWPPRLPTCVCSASPPAASTWPRARSPARATAPVAARATARKTARVTARPMSPTPSPLPASLPRRWPRPRRGSRTPSSMAPPPPCCSPPTRFEPAR